MPKAYPPRQFTTEIRLEREAQKFSAAHMTIFVDGSKEALHGHNYQVSVRLSTGPHAFSRTSKKVMSEMLPFALLKKEIKSICDSLDEKILLPETSPLLKTIPSGRKENVDFTVCGAFYSLPKSEVIWLPVPTISCETLSETFLGELLARIPEKTWKTHKVRGIQVEILESPHQGASAKAEW